MPDSGKTVGLICFGPYELSLDNEELRKEGNRLKLSGQAIQVLVVLANNRGKLVTREELQQRLWPGATCGDFEHGLNAAVNRLRETLGDSATEPIYIETVPRRGYRFVADVSQSHDATSDVIVVREKTRVSYEEEYESSDPADGAAKINSIDITAASASRQLSEGPRKSQLPRWL